MTQDFLGTERLSKLFIKFAIPSIIGMIFIGIQGIIDGVFVGNLVGGNALASVNLAQPYVQIVMAYSLIISVGAQSIIGINLGKNDKEKARDIFKTAVIIVVAISILILILGVGFSEEIAKILGANDVLLEGTATYIKYLSLFTVFLSTMFLFDLSVRSIGKPNISLASMVISVLLNVVLDYIFIKELNLGIKGAALATGMSYSTAFFIEMIPFLKKSEVINLFKGKFDKRSVVPMVYNGSSEGISSVATALSMFLFNTALMKIAGEGGIAAFSIINYIAQIGYMILFGISDGVRPIISYNYGAKNEERLKKLLKASIIVNLVIGVIIFIILSIFSEPLILIFLKDGKDVLELATNGAKIYGLTFLFNGVNIFVSGYFTAIDDARSSIMVATSRGIVFILVGICTLPYIFGINGIWGTTVFAEVVTLFMCVKLLKKNHELALINQNECI